MKKYSNSNKATQILHNIYLLYFIFIIAIINIIYLANEKDIISVIVFIVSGLIVSRFSKNMIVILCLAIVVSNIFKHGIYYYRGGGEDGGKQYENFESETKEREEHFSEYIKTVSQIVGSDVTNPAAVIERFEELKKQKETIQNRLNSIS